MKENRYCSIILKKLIEKYKKEYAHKLSSDFFENMLQIGFSKDETINYLRKIGGEQ